jgi:replicative DNA helicase
LSKAEVLLNRPLPSANDAERAVLGSILINNVAFYRVVDIVGPDDFFPEKHRLIFAAMRTIAERSAEIDLFTVKDELAKLGTLKKCGGAAYVSSLVDGIPDVANVERYARIVKDKSTLRRVIETSNTAMNAAVNEADPIAVVGDMERAILAIAEGSQTRGFENIHEITRRNLHELETAQNSGKALTGIDTGYADLNRFTHGWQPTDLIIIAARPSMGKTALMLSCAEAIGVPRQSREPLSVGLFSLEMSKEQLGKRLLSAMSGVPGDKMRSAMLNQSDWRAIAEASAKLSRARLHIDDTAAIDPLELRARARRLKAERGLDLVMVDYLQLMRVKGRVENRLQEVSLLSSSLKALAKELRVPVIALSQLSRDVEKRQDHRPQLSDLRESGTIEQDADVVMFIYRDEVYNKDTADKGLAEILIAKQRNGPIGDFKLVFRNDLTRFYDYTPEPAIEVPPPAHDDSWSGEQEAFA